MTKTESMEISVCVKMTTKILILFLTIICLSATMAGADTIQTCRSMGLRDCVVNQPTTVTSGESPFIFENFTLTSTITVTPDSSCGNAGSGLYGVGPGGGCFTLFARHINITGTIKADGGLGWCGGDPGWQNEYIGGGGAGGTIRLFADNISGAGTIRANGGPTNNEGCSCGGQSGGGAGGSVEFYANHNHFLGTISAIGGTEEIMGGYAGQGSGGSGHPGDGGSPYCHTYSGGSSTQTRAIYVCALGNMTVTAGINGSVNYLGADPSISATYKIFWGPTIWIRQANNSPYSQKNVNICESNNTANPLLSTTTNAYGLVRNQTLSFSEYTNYTINITDIDTNCTITFSSYGNSYDSATMIAMTPGSRNVSMKAHKIVIYVYNQSGYPVAGERINLTNYLNGEIVAVGKTNASGVAYFWLPSDDIDSRPYEMDYDVSIESSAYQRILNYSFMRPGILNCSQIGADVRCIADWHIPREKENIGADATNLRVYNETAISSVADYTWHRENIAKIRYMTSVNMSPIKDLDKSIDILDRFVYVNTTREPNLNKPANITFYGIDCNDPLAQRIYYSAGSYGHDDVVTKGVLCTSCTNRACVGGEDGNFSFQVPHFTGYAVGANSNLTIYDQIEYNGIMGQYNATMFYANYTNLTSGAHISAAECNISFDDSPGTWYTMNDTGSNYEYNKTAGFTTSGNHTWYVTCDHDNFSMLNAEDNITIEMTVSIPEFGSVSSMLIIILICATICALFLRRRR